MLSGTFDVVLYARPGQKLDELVQRADAEVERLKTEGPTAGEVLKAQNRSEVRFVVGLAVDRPAGPTPSTRTTSSSAPARLQERAQEDLRGHTRGREAGGQQVPGRPPGPARRDPRLADAPRARGHG